MLAKTWLSVVPFAWLVTGLSGGCGGTTVATSTCRIDTNVPCATGLDGYSCGGADRPDLIADTTKSVSEPLCTTTKPVNGRSGYCCTTNRATQCGFDPRVLCPMEGDFGFSCLGTNRPNSYNENLICGQGIHEYGLISYCCGENTPGATSDGGPVGCARNTNVSCGTSGSNAATLGFTCATANQLPTETDLGMNQSRSEVPLICTLSTPDIVDNTQTDYCCYTPTAAPPSYTCLQDQLIGQVQNVPGCKPGVTYGFACIGTQDTPDLDYPRMSCPNPPVPGINQNGQPALLYCCNYSIKP